MCDRVRWSSYSQQRKALYHVGGLVILVVSLKKGERFIYHPKLPALRLAIFRCMEGSVRGRATSGRKET